MWKPARWSVFLQKVRTNNDLEGWHHRLNRNAGWGQLQFYLLVELLHQESEYVAIQRRLIQNGELQRVERKEYRQINARIQGVWDEFTNSDITAKQLLRRCGRIYGPVPQPSQQDTDTMDI